MARTGRPPKPTALKILTGNPGKRPLPANEPQPDAGIPPKPNWLSPEASTEWDRITPELAKVRLLTLVDLAGIAAYCQAYAELEESTRVLNAEGRMIQEPWAAKGGGVLVDDDGEPLGYYTKPHPMVKLQRDAFTRVKQFLSEFGLSPSSRVRVSGSEDKPTQSTLSAFARKRSG